MCSKSETNNACRAAYGPWIMPVLPLISLFVAYLSINYVLYLDFPVPQATLWHPRALKVGNSNKNMKMNLGGE